MSKQEDFCYPEKPLEKTREFNNEAKISKKAEIEKNSIEIRSGKVEKQNRRNRTKVGFKI